MAIIGVSCGNIDHIGLLVSVTYCGVVCLACVKENPKPGSGVVVMMTVHYDDEEDEKMEPNVYLVKTTMSGAVFYEYLKLSEELDDIRWNKTKGKMTFRRLEL